MYMWVCFLYTLGIDSVSKFLICKSKMLVTIRNEYTELMDSLDDTIQYVNLLHWFRFWQISSHPRQHVSYNRAKNIALKMTNKMAAGFQQPQYLLISFANLPTVFIFHRLNIGVTQIWKMMSRCRVSEIDIYFKLSKYFVMGFIQISDVVERT